MHATSEALPRGKPSPRRINTSSRSVQAHHLEFVLHGIGNGGIARVGYDNRRAVGTEQGKELKSGLDRGCGST